MKFIGISIFVCLAALVAMPAFAAAPAWGSSTGHAITAAGEAKLLGFAENLTSTLGQNGVNVDNLNSAIESAQSAIASSNTTAFMDAMKTFNQDVQAGIKSGSIPKTALQGMGPGPDGFRKSGTTAPVMNTAMETKMLGFADNLTASLQGKDVNDPNLNAALGNAQIAIQDSNSSAFMNAMKLFGQDIQAGIKDGSIPKSDLPQFGQNHGGNTHSFTSLKSHTKHTNSATFT